MQIVMKFCSSYIYNYFETNSATTDMPKQIVSNSFVGLLTNANVNNLGRVVPTAFLSKYQP